ncbi:ABC transporter ATP-binding protein [Saccharibacillus alkalitolerans]|uniref:ABC transporter ATP-binding protein n=1 Tax=Saccharibacillus alkalitolerans TaxID=2705290 RepID=A0ABX0F990_9BACL|nr:ABC transporter ATP-binding protein [Saccharibacillus alkalitolerans]NGZ77462.1 ABC transporter ATP-binding protein [Saccharibacillus alkalitolerans]
MAIIQVESLSKDYKGKHAVSDLNLDVRAGEIYGFIGPNGAGKSTTIRMIMQLAKPTSGRILLFGQEALRPSPELRRRIGYLPSEIRLYERWTGRESLAFTARAYGLKLDGTDFREQAGMLDLDLDKKIKSYSLGNRKKLGLIQCLLHKPDLLILDEPTSGLDPLIQRKLIDMLKRQREDGMTIFFSTHVLSEVERLCDRVAMIRGGRLLRVENVEGFSGARRHVFKVRFAGEEDRTRELGLREFDDGAFLKDGVHRFSADGPLGPVLRKLSGCEIVELTVERPTLEDVFMRDYEQEEER